MFARCFLALTCVSAALGSTGVAHGQPASCGTPLFPGQQFPLDYAPYWLEGADVNADGSPDLIALTGLDVLVLLGAGDGTFTGPIEAELPVAGQSAAIGDLDGDCDPDLVVVAYLASANYQGSVFVLLGNGDGTFAQPVVYKAGIYSLSVSVGDLDGDGDADLAVANAGIAPDYDGNVSVLLGNGDGTFADAVTYPAGHASLAVAIGDLDGDGDGDLAVGNYFSQDVTILLGHGDGTFSGGALLSFPSANYSSLIRVDDLDGDGHADLAVTGGNVSILFGRGDGTFAPPMVLHTDGRYFVLTEDLDGDGDVDVAVPTNEYAVNYDEDSVEVLINSGGAHFASAVRYPVGANPRALAAADFDGDGALDLAVANKPYNADSNSVTILLGRGNGVFAAARMLEIPSAGYLPTVGDLDGDGDVDLAVANGPDGGISVLLAAGDGTFAEPVGYGAGLAVGPQAVADMNGDGHVDIVALEGGFWPQVWVFPGNGDGTYQPPVNSFAGNAVRHLAVSDFDGDGHLDVAVTMFSLDLVGIMLGNGDGTFANPVFINYAVGDAPASIAAGDLDGDGDADLAVGNYLGGSVSVMLGNGDGTFAPAVHYSTGGSNRPRWVVLADLDHDTDLDLAVANYDTSYGRASVLLNNGNGTFAPAVHYPLPGAPVHVAVGDLDRDGNADLVTANSSSGNVSLLRGLGDGTFAAAVSYAAAGRPGWVGVADVDSDNDQDAIVWGSLGIALLFNNSCPTGDLNGDCEVNDLDLIELLPCLGQSPEPPCQPADLNHDGVVNVLDLIDLLLAFGTTCL